MISNQIEWWTLIWASVGVFCLGVDLGAKLIGKETPEIICGVGGAWMLFSVFVTVILKPC